MSGIFLSACSKKTEQNTVFIQPEEPSHGWYYFSDSNFHKIKKIQEAPVIPQKPWTEAVRISSASVAANPDETKMTPPKGYAVVNRTGILLLQENHPVLYPDADLFSGRTAQNLVFVNDTPVFSVYKSSFFNTSQQNSYSLHPFLIQFNPGDGICYPIVNVDSLGLSSTSEITDFIWNGHFWTCSIKDSDSGKIEFSCLTFQPKEPVLSITPATASSQLQVNETSFSDYKKIKTQTSFANAPEQLKQMLKTLPDNLLFRIKVYTAGSHSPRTFVHSKNQAETSDFSATAILADTWSMIIFQDGTAFFRGALYNHQILNGGKTIGLKLPKLPEGFVYGEFAVSGTTLYTAWEESSFFQTGRSGFLQVDLNKILYKNGDVK